MSKAEVKIPMSIKIGLELKNVWRNKTIIPMLIKIGPEFHCLQG